MLFYFKFMSYIAWSRRGEGREKLIDVLFLFAYQYNNCYIIMSIAVLLTCIIRFTEFYIFTSSLRRLISLLYTCAVADTVLLNGAGEGV